MKKALLTLLAFAGIGFSANAQLAPGTVAPDFTLTDINGVSHQLYKYLDSGYTVILDHSATWCPPCWQAHKTGVLEKLYEHYGPNGTITPKKVRVFYIESESSNTTAQLYGPAGGSSYADKTLGDWVTGTSYPIIDKDLNSQYATNSFPTFTIICRDRLVLTAFAGGFSNSYPQAQESWWLNLIDMVCPTYGAAPTGLDAKPVTYMDKLYFLCNPVPKVKFQNYSKSGNITAATIDILDGSNNVVATQNWTGTLAPYAVTTVNIPSFTALNFMPYKFRVTVPNDVNTGNNVSFDSLFKAFTKDNSAQIPYSENFESVADYMTPDRFSNEDGAAFVYSDPSLIGTTGQPTKAAVMGFYFLGSGQSTEMFAGNYNTQNASAIALSFDVAYAQSSSENDQLEVLVSTNCGTSWSSVWSKSGSALSTANAVGPNAQFAPGSASDWRHESVNISTYKNENMLVKFKATATGSYGNLAWVDNFKINNSLSVANVITGNSIALYPNPAKGNVSISFNLEEKTNVQIQIIDAMGRVVKNVIHQDMQAGAQKAEASTADLAAGIYHVKIQTEQGSYTERLTVVN